ncbi:hypothetical protein QCA50_011359 [Cerrena zonata]|uniref:Uncharacterized protein n=1 Tax=Cerrena zonata TaxID=2478898 RepID=A0AAW0G912_9APHY
MVWDDPNDFSMTKAVIEALEEDRYPTLHDLVEKVANRLRKCATELHKWSQDRQNSYMERERGRQALVLAGNNPPHENAPAIELAAYWKPQIGSTKYMV